MAESFLVLDMAIEEVATVGVASCEPRDGGLVLVDGRAGLRAEDLAAAATGM